VVASAKAELDEFAEGVELLREKLAGADDAEGLVAVALLNVTEAMDHGIEGFVPGDGSEDAIFAKQRLFGAPRCSEDVMLGEPLGAELAAVDGMIRVPACRDRLVVSHADEHAAADRTVAAGGLDPLLRNPRLGGVAEDGVLGVVVLFAAYINADESFEVGEEGAHTCTDRTKVSAMLSGTTATKKRYRAETTPASAAGKAKTGRPASDEGWRGR
jgi:hypothetical protein